MAKEPIPVYSICSLSGQPQASADLIADHFDHYLEEHKNLHFPHKHSFYHLVYFSEGAGEHAIDFVRFKVEPGQVYFMNPGQVHAWHFEGKMNGFIINFSEQYLQELLSNARYLDQFSFFSGQAAQQVILIPRAQRPGLTALFETIFREYYSSDLLKDDFARTALLQLLILVQRQQSPIQKSANQYNSVLLRNFQKLVEQHYKTKKLTRDYAAMLYVTPNHLNALTRDLDGRSAGELIRDRILLEAKRLLVNAEMSIAEIAAELDFEDNSYFSKFFKKYTGQTPQVFRIQITKNAQI